MKIQESVRPLWSMTKNDLDLDDIGKEFIAYMELWCDTAERLYEEDNGPDSAVDIRTCVMTAMETPETERGPIVGGYLGSMLMYMINAWEYGPQLAEQLSPVEAKMVAAAAQQQLEENKATAEARENEEENISGVSGNVSSPGGDD